MGSSRVLPLFDEKVQPASWNERMTPGEYAVHYSEHDGLPTCTVFGSLAEAEAHAKEQIAQRPTLRCRIYDHQGFVGKPILELRGESYKGDSEMSPRFRRWAGSILFFGGALLILLDWSHDFSLSWPAMIGIRMIIPGLFLLLTEVLIVIYARMKSERGRQGKSA
jgi:hypothetical protein